MVGSADMVDEKHMDDTNDFHREDRFLDQDKSESPSLTAHDEEDVSNSDNGSSRIRPIQTDGARGTLARIITGQSISASFRDPGPPPDGGLTAWTQVAMGHLVILNTWGFVSSFGVFQTYYSRALGHPPSDISWVGSMQIFLLFFIGTLSGRATDAGLFRPVFFSGYAFQVIGIFMTSLSRKYWQLFLAQGLCIGIGNGLQFCPTMSLVSTYFSKNRALALGIAATGSATGGIIYPILVQQLLPRIGFGWTVRVLGFVTIGTGAVAGCLLRTRVPPRKSGPVVEWAAFKELTYLLVCIGMFLNFWALYFGFFYVGAFGRDIIGISYSDSISLLLIMNGVGAIGRIIPNFLADRYLGALNTIIPFGFLCGVLIFAWSGVHNQPGLIGFATIYGLFAAGIQSMFPATLASLTTDLKKTGVRMGMCFSVVSLATLTGPPLAGALIQSNNGNYLHAQMWAGTVLTCGGLTLIAARVAKTGWVLWCRI